MRCQLKWFLYGFHMKIYHSYCKSAQSPTLTSFENLLQKLICLPWFSSTGALACSPHAFSTSPFWGLAVGLSVLKMEWLSMRVFKLHCFIGSRTSADYAQWALEVRFVIGTEKTAIPDDFHQTSQDIFHENNRVDTVILSGYMIIGVRSISLTDEHLEGSLEKDYDNLTRFWSTITAS